MPRNHEPTFYAPRHCSLFILHPSSFIPRQVAQRDPGNTTGPVRAGCGAGYDPRSSNRQLRPCGGSGNFVTRERGADAHLHRAPAGALGSSRSEPLRFTYHRNNRRLDLRPHSAGGRFRCLEHRKQSPLRCFLVALFDSICGRCGGTGVATGLDGIRAFPGSYFRW